MAPIAVLAGVTLTLRGRRVLDGIDLALAPGETLALLGPNGAGKTSLMRLVAGRLAPEAGTVRVGGADPHRSGEARRAVGWVPQEIALYPRLTVAENLSVFAQLSGLPRRERREAVERALALGDIAPSPGGSSRPCRGLPAPGQHRRRSDRPAGSRAPRRAHQRRRPRRPGRDPHRAAPLAGAGHGDPHRHPRLPRGRAAGGPGRLPRSGADRAGGAARRPPRPPAHRAA
ncbi:ATP-binding cassette domain-containing protein [Methylobacterium persicinum]